MKTKGYRSNRILSNTELLNAIGIPEKEVSTIIRQDYCDASLDNFKSYEYSLYEVILN